MKERDKLRGRVSVCGRKKVKRDGAHLEVCAHAGPGRHLEALLQSHHLPRRPASPEAMAQAQKKKKAASPQEWKKWGREVNRLWHSIAARPKVTSPRKREQVGAAR